MDKMDRYCFKSYEFEENIRKYFGKLRDDQRLFDVTLATDDGQHVQAHRTILSAGSHFFSDIFMKSSLPNMLIYLMGTRSTELNNLIDFLYNGEAFIPQEDLEVFLETGREFKVKGLQCVLTGVGENVGEIVPEDTKHHKTADEYSTNEDDLHHKSISDQR